MFIGIQQVQRARFAFAIVAALSILLGSIVAASPEAHAALHHQLSSEHSDAHDHDASGSHDHGDRETDGDHGDCFVCELSSGRLFVEVSFDTMVPRNPLRADIGAVALTVLPEAVDLRLPPILGPPAV